MQSEEIRIGASYTCRVGRNAVVVRVAGASADGGWQVETHTGRTMAIRDPERFVARVGGETGAAEAPAPATEPAAAPPEAPEAGEAAATVEAPAVEPAEGAAPPVPEAQAAGERSEGTEAEGGTMGLLDAAVHLLGRAEGPMQCRDMVEQARAQGLWTPRRGGKTPDRTLYAAILREITTKGEAARFRKTERGRFALKD
ncbi:MAG: hypothetical protein GX595_15570 [Lentisphaerae bacterium]|nr:hypothetical protein [Lentisphaerota bacterium]